MATTAPETTESAAAGWLDPFLADWRPGTGEPREIREPATGRPLLTLPQATPDDVARAAAAAAAAQPAWAETNYAERAAILRRAAEIYEAHRPEFGTWTQRETGAPPQQDAPRAELRRRRAARRGDDADPALRPARPERRPGPPLDAPPRPGRRHRRDHAMELAERAGDAGRRAGARGRQRGHPQARSPDAGLRRRDVRGGLPRGGPARRPAPRRPRRRRDRRGDRHRPEREPGLVHGLDRRPGGGSGRSPAGC